MTRYVYPDAPRLDRTDVMHGRSVPDPYRWLEDRDDARTVAWSAAQRRLFARECEGWAGRDDLVARLVDLASFDAVSLPRPRGERIFFAVRGARQDQPVLYVQEPDEQVRELIDPLAIDPAGTTTLEAWHPSIEGQRLAYQLACGGDEQVQLRVLDVHNGQTLDGPIGRLRRTPVAWLPGGDAFYYVRRLPPEMVPPDEAHYHRRVYLHRVGTDPDRDMLIFGSGRDKADYYGVTVSADGRWLCVSVTAGTARRNDLWLADLSVTGPEHPDFCAVQQGMDVRTVPYLRRGTGPNDEFCLLTERDAEFGRLAVSTAAAMADSAWRDLAAEEPPTVLVDFAVLDGDALDRPRVIVVRNRSAVSEITVHDGTDGTLLAKVPLPGLGRVEHVVDRIEGGHEAWFTYADFTTPRTVYRYDARSGELQVWGKPARPAVPIVQVRHVKYRSMDGTPVRMFVLSPRGVADRPRSTILTAYGGFGVPTAPEYLPLALAWVEAGGVFADAQIRGGSEEGERWHRAGMRGQKQNCFDDFAAAADWLTDNGWTTTEQLGILGGSNGGLLIGAALTQHPGRWSAAVCSAPLLDMVRYELSGLGPSWRAEYGSATDPVEFEWLLSYSPYHHVRDATAYPAVLFTVFDADTRVDPMHARKLCAALQHASSGDRPVLIRTESEVGHGLRGVKREVGLIADTLSFFAAQLNLGGAADEGGSSRPWWTVRTD
ncbi:MAG: prolyl oligopeptidase family serine peptidase [Micromonosporaceae bacterium]